jgi:hypothetical protein
MELVRGERRRYERLRRVFTQRRGSRRGACGGEAAWFVRLCWPRIYRKVEWILLDVTRVCRVECLRHRSGIVPGRHVGLEQRWIATLPCF